MAKSLRFYEKTSSQTAKKIFQKIMLSLLIFMFFLSGIFQHISDSEFWPISLARLFGPFNENYFSLFYKFFFHAILKIPYFFELSSVQHLIFVRVIFSAIGLLSIVLFFIISRRLFQSRNTPIFLTALLLSCLFYFSQWSRIRSDLIVLAICLIGIYLNMRWENKHLRHAVLGVASFLMILTTPKAIYWIVILCIFCWPGLIYISIPLFGISLVFIGTSLVFDSQRIIEAYSSAIFYFLNTLSVLMSNANILFYELGHFLSLHMVQMIISVTGVWIYFSKHKNMKHKIVLAFFAALFFLIFHPQRFSFFAGALLPFLILPAGYFYESYAKTPSAQRIWWSIAVLIAIQSFFLTSPQHWWRFNGLELDKIAEIESLMMRVHGAQYFDGLGVLPRQNQVMAYLGPQDEDAILGAIELLRVTTPQFVLKNSRSYLMEPKLSMRLEKEYTEVRRGVFVENKSKDLFKVDLSEKPLSYYFSYLPAY